MQTTTHPPQEPGVESDDLHTTTIAMVGLISAALVLACALGVQALYETYVQIDRDAKYENPKYAASSVDTQIQAQRDTLYGSPRAVQGQSGVYTLPIDDAMALIVKEVSEGQQDN